jgi:F-type H+-transporting ATPase subunit epsilon
MSTALQVEVVTPETVFFSGDAQMLEAPGQEGDFGILPEHAPFVSLLKPGIVTIHVGGEKKRLFVSSGMAQVENNRCVVLAEAVHEPEKVTLAQAQQMLKDALKKQKGCEAETAEFVSAAKEVHACERLCEVIGGE